MILPWRIGEMVRALLLSYTARARLSSVLATVVVERFTDLLVVTVIFVILSIYKFIPSDVAILFGFSSMLFFVAVSSINYSARIRRAVWFFSSLFNNDIKAAILHFIYILLNILFKRPILVNWRYWILTSCMWFLYLFSLGIFSLVVERSLLEVASLVYIDNLLFTKLLNFDGDGLWLLLYLTIPIPIILIYANISGFNALAGFKSALQEAANIERIVGGLSIGRLHGFHSDDHYHSFLERFFHGQGGLLSDFEQRGINDVRVHRIFHGGSGAVTALIVVDDQFRVRKFASGLLVKKLKIQYEWIIKNQKNLKLVKLIGSLASNEDYYYDMYYEGGSVGFYEGIHTESVYKSIELVNKVLLEISKFHDLTKIESADDGVVSNYVHEKVVVNYKLIKTEFADVLNLGKVVLNGMPFDFKKLEIFESPKWFIAQFKQRGQSCIHGDLTIENIMLSNLSSSDCDWFLIDPNPDNIFQSPLIDFSKLMQSLHLGYESLHRMPKISLIGNNLNIGIHRSSQYERLYIHILEVLEKKFSKTILKEIYLHEIVNYLRLVPYQLKQSRESGLVFFSCLCILLRDFDVMFPGEIDK
jgi:hypothetical protein